MAEVKEEKVSEKEVKEETKELKNKKEKTDKKEDKEYSKGAKTKKLAKTLMIIGMLLIPGIIVLLIVGTHSHLLITKLVTKILYVIGGLSVLSFLIGLILLIINKKEEIIKPIKKWVKVVFTIFMILYVVGCTAFIILLYGPYHGFKDWLITTAMNTMHHQYYCKWFYSQADIDETFSRNYFEEVNESTDEDLVDTETPIEVPEEETYANEYEEAMFKGHTEDEIYRILTFQVNGCTARLGVVFDPSKVKVTTTSKVGVTGEFVTTMAKREHALLAINGGGFYDPNWSSNGGMPRGIVIKNGKIVTNNQYKAVTVGGIIGITKKNKLVLLKNTTAKQALEKGVRDAVSWGPFLIVNGKSSYSKGNGGWGYAARTAIGQRADGVMLLLVVDSNANRTKGASMHDLARIMERYGAINASNLDGGTSSVMVENGYLINDPIDSTLTHATRPIATAFIVTE